MMRNNTAKETNITQLVDLKDPDRCRRFTNDIFNAARETELTSTVINAAREPKTYNRGRLSLLMTVSVYPSDADGTEPVHGRRGTEWNAELRRDAEELLYSLAYILEFW